MQGAYLIDEICKVKSNSYNADKYFYGEERRENDHC